MGLTHELIHLMHRLGGKLDSGVFVGYDKEEFADANEDDRVNLWGMGDDLHTIWGTYGTEFDNVSELTFRIADNIPIRMFCPQISNKLKSHESHPRNKLIADTFYRRGLVEQWGTGTIKMMSICKAQNVPLPEFEEYSGGFAVIFKFRKPAKLSLRETEDIEHLNSRQREIVEILKREGPLSPRDLLTKLKTTVTERTLRRDLSSLEKSGVVDSRGQARAILWFVCT